MALKVNRSEIDKMSMSELTQMAEYLDTCNNWIRVNFHRESRVLRDEIDRRLKVVFPEFDPYKHKNEEGYFDGKIDYI